MVGIVVFYLHQDALGNTRLETTSTVSVKFSSNYVPYGNNYAMTGKEVFMYTGKPYDSATGLYYYGARWYDPGIGRFITQDSWNGTRYDPLSQNKYLYARDNPERYVDPTGHYNGRSLTEGGSDVTVLSAITVSSSAWATISTVTTVPVLVGGGNQIGEVEAPQATLAGTWTTTANRATGQYYVSFTGVLVTAGIGGAAMINLGAPIKDMNVQTTSNPAGFTVVWPGGVGDTEVGISSFGFARTSISLTSQVMQMHGDNPFSQVMASLETRSPLQDYPSVDVFRGTIQTQFYGCYQ